MMNPHSTPHMAHSHPGGSYPPHMYGAGPNGPPLPPSGGPPPGMPPTPGGHHMHHGGPPPPPPQAHGHPHHLSRGPPPPPPSQANGLPPPPGGPSPRVMHGAAMPHPDGPSMAPPPPRSASAAGHHAAAHSHGPPPYDLGGPGQPMTIVQKLAQSNEQAWISIGLAAESMEDPERALFAYESALRHNPYSVPAMNAIAGVHRTAERFEKAVDYFQSVLNIVPENGETWGAMGHCYLMMDDLQKAYTAYQQALYHLPNPKEPKLWYGIGILYDRYGSLEHAEEAFASVVHMDPNYEKANEIYFRLGIIYKQQNKYQASLECFRYILNNPPRPLTQVDIWFQIGHVYEQQREFGLAKEAYERVLSENPLHAKVLQQLGWLYHQSDAGFENQEQAIHFLTKSLESDPNDAQSWYLLGRAYMAGRNYNKAYEAYQQAVYRDGKNPTFWCSIGVLYYQISQYRDALDAYSRAIRLNPYISEVWFDLGSLYESCNNQVSDAIDAYARAAELDPDNPHIKQRLTLLRNAEERGEQVSSVPMPQDVHPTAYANHPSALGGPPGPGGLGSGYGGAPPLHVEGESPRNLPGPPRAGNGGASPPGRDGYDPAASIPNIDDRGTMKGPAHTQLAPMETPGGTVSPPSREHAHGRTSPRAQAFSQRSGMSEYEEREREMARERDSRAHGAGNGRGPYDRAGPAQASRFEHSHRQPEMSEHDAGAAARGPSAKGARKPPSDGRGKGKSSSRVASPAPKVKQQAPASPGSDSSSGSNRPLAAGSAAQQATRGGFTENSSVPAPSKARIVDEDYDEGAADALMGLAGAATASAQLTPREEKKQEPASFVASTVEKEAPRSNGDEYPASIGASTDKSENERLAQVKERAENAARAEEEDEAKRQRETAQQTNEEVGNISRKREASADAVKDADASKRQRNGEPEAVAVEIEAQPADAQGGAKDAAASEDATKAVDASAAQDASKAPDAAISAEVADVSMNGVEEELPSKPEEPASHSATADGKVEDPIAPAGPDAAAKESTTEEDGAQEANKVTEEQVAHGKAMETAVNGISDAATESAPDSIAEPAKNAETIGLSESVSSEAQAEKAEESGKGARPAATAGNEDAPAESGSRAQSEPEEGEVA